MNETLKVLKERRSCRNFKPEMVKEDELKAIIEAEPSKDTAPRKENYVYCVTTSERDKVYYSIR